MTYLELLELQLSKLSEFKAVVIKCQDFPFAVELRQKEKALQQKIEEIKNDEAKNDEAKNKNNNY